MDLEQCMTVSEDDACLPFVMLTDNNYTYAVCCPCRRTCTCPGCAALAVQAVRMAHAHAGKLYHTAEHRHTGSDPDRIKAVGRCLARVVHVYISLLLDSDAQASPTRASVWRAEQCLKEWERLDAAGLAEGLNDNDRAKVCVVGFSSQFIQAFEQVYELYPKSSILIFLSRVYNVAECSLAR
jgi:hypothetical protein